MSPHPPCSAIIGSMDVCHARDYTHVLFVSPDAPSQPVFYWLGKYQPCSSCPGEEGKFLIEDADGPFRCGSASEPQHQQLQSTRLWAAGWCADRCWLLARLGSAVRRAGWTWGMRHTRQTHWSMTMVGAHGRQAAFGSLCA